MSEHQSEEASPLAWRGVVATLGLYTLIALAAVPWAASKLPEIPSLTPFVVGGTLAFEFSTSFLLFARFRQAGTWSALLLASAYFYSGLMLILHLLTFPGAVLPDQVIIGDRQSAALTFQLWTNGFAALALASVVIEARRGPSRIAPGAAGRLTAAVIGGVLMLGIAGGITVTALVDHMPALLRGSSWTSSNTVLNVMGVGMMATALAIILLVMKRRSELYLWLSLSLAAMILSNVVALTGGGRYTLGWVLARVNWMISGCALFIFFMTQFAKQQVMLARANTSLEQNVAARTAELTKTIRQRDILLREVYHRVNNNLQVVASFIVLEGRGLEDPAANLALVRLRNRVWTLGLVHKQLMSSQNLETITLESFLRELVNNVSESYGAAEAGTSIVVHADPLAVHLDFAITVGLLATELLSNALKHAGATAVIIEFRHLSNLEAILSVRDNGPEARTGATRMAVAQGVGAKIIEGLTRQLEGRMDITHEDGLCVAIHMPVPAVA